MNVKKAAVCLYYLVMFNSLECVTTCIL